MDWLSAPIYCNDEIVSESINADRPLLPAQRAIAFRVRLLFRAWEAFACDGRQMAIEDLDRIEDFESSLSRSDLSENELAEITRELRDFIPVVVSDGRIDVPEHTVSLALDGDGAA